MISNNEFDDWGQQGAPQEESQDGASGGVDLMQVAMRRKGLIALGIFVGLCLGLLYYAQATPIFESVAMLSIDEKAPPMRTVSGIEQGLQLRTAAEDHAIRIRTPKIIVDALDMDGGKLRDLDSLASVENPVETIYEGLVVEPIQDGSEVLTLQYRGTHAEDCEMILDHLMFAYREFLDLGQRNVGEEMRDWITQARDEVRIELEDAKRKYKEFKESHANLFILGEENATLTQQRLLYLEKMVNDEREKLGDITSRLTVIEEGLKEKRDPRWLLAIAEGGLTSQTTADEAATDRAMQVERMRVDGQRELRSYDRVVPIRMRLEMLRQRYGADHPEVKSLLRQLRIAQRAHTEDAQELEAFKGQDSVKVAAGRLAVLKGSLAQDANRIARRLKLLQDEFKIYQQKAEDLTRDISDKEGHLETIARHTGMYEAIVQKVADVNLLVSAGGDKKVDIQTLQRPAPGLRVEPSLAKSLAVGTMLGFLAGFGLGYLVEMFDKTFRSPQEVSKVLQLPMVGHIPEITCQKPEESSLADVLVTAHKPKSPLAENFRAIRTALYFSTAGQQNHVIQTTSPVPGDGKSTLTANIAVTIAQSNKSVLLVDADFRRPTQHKLFGLKNEVGLSSVVTEQVEPDAGVHATEVPNLYVMGSGPRPHNPSELLTSPQFAELVESIREQYDFVLIDTPPVLAVTDPGIVSARVDGVIMCLRIRKNGRPSAVRARKVLHDLDANMLGIVVNGIDHRSGSYGYYSSYRRGYGYNYAYKYGYGYGMDKTEKAINKYFEEPKKKSETTPLS